jgi:hypothetical protein
MEGEERRDAPEATGEELGKLGDGVLDAAARRGGLLGDGTSATGGAPLLAEAGTGSVSSASESGSPHTGKDRGAWVGVGAGAGRD